MKPAVKRWTNVPYGGVWRCRHPSTGFLLEGRNKLVLIANAKAYCQANNLPIGLTFDDDVEEWVCREMPDECTMMEGAKAARQKSLSMADVERGTRVMLKFWREGSKLVDPEEAKRRADICASCPMNVTFRKPCGGLCGWLKGLVQRIVGKPSDPRLNSCAVCRCFLAASVWLELDTQCAGVTPEMKEVFATVAKCWKRC